MKLNSILVVLTYPRFSGLLKVATELAHRSGAEIKAVYVADKDWFEASRISFSTQVSSFRGEVIPYTEELINEQSQALAARFERMFASFSKSMKIKYTCQSIRDRVETELQQAAREADLVMVQKGRPWLGQNKRVGETVQKLITETKVPLLVWDEVAGYELAEVVGVCFSPEESSEIIEWSLKVGTQFNMNIRLLWPQLPEWSNIAIRPSDEANKSGTLQQLLASISTVHPVRSAEDLRYYRKALIVVQRGDWNSRLFDLLNNLSNPFLIL